MMITILAFSVALFFAINIGASGAAASMGIAYGSGAVKNRRIALIICGIGVFLGATLGGGEVVKTLGSGIIPKAFINVNIALIILTAATFTLFIANLIGIPLSTSEVTVGAIVGIGIAYEMLYISALFNIVILWIIIPFVAFLLSFILAKLINYLEKKMPMLKGAKWTKILTILLIITGFLEAFSSGMNNVANSVGPIVATDIISVQTGIFVGGIFVGLGAIFLGSKVIETNGKKITELSLLQGSAVSGLGAFLVILASIFGLPVPHTQITTCSILGVGMSNKGKAIFQKEVISRLLKVWLVSPVFSLIISYNLVKLFLEYDIYPVVMVVCVLVGTLGVISLLPKKEKKNVKVKTIEVPVKVGGKSL